MDSMNDMSAGNARRRLPRPLVARFLWWSGVLLIGLALGLWVNTQFEARSVVGGAELAQKLVGMNREAFRLLEEGNRRGALDKLKEAVSIMESAEGFKDTALYVYTLTDLGVLLLSDEQLEEVDEGTASDATHKLDESSAPSSPDPAEAEAALSTLETAWQSSKGMAAPVRARIARSMGYGKLVHGDLKEAVEWYREAAALSPDDTEVGERLKAAETALELGEH